jgi:hypothetical protein
MGIAPELWLRQILLSIHKIIVVAIASEHPSRFCQQDGHEKATAAAMA